jgi:hypothetical protein
MVIIRLGKDAPSYATADGVADLITDDVLTDAMRMAWINHLERVTTDQIGRDNIARVKKYILERSPELLNEKIPVLEVEGEDEHLHPLAAQAAHAKQLLRQAMPRRNPDDF